MITENVIGLFLGLLISLEKFLGSLLPAGFDAQIQGLLAQTSVFQPFFVIANAGLPITEMWGLMMGSGGAPGVLPAILTVVVFWKAVMFGKQFIPGLA